MKRITTGLLVCASVLLMAQSKVDLGNVLSLDALRSVISTTDTLVPALLSDSCNSAATYYLLDGRIITGPARLNDGSYITRIGQQFDSGEDSLRIGGVFAGLVHLSAGTGNGSFVAEIYTDSLLQTPLAQSLPVASTQLSDTSGASIYNDFYFTNPVFLKGKFWIVFDLVNNGDSIFLASTGDDCGGGRAIYYNSGSWRTYRDYFQVSSGDPMDIALIMGAFVQRVIGINEAIKEQEMAIYPNPASDFIEVQLPAQINGGELELLDVSGKQIRKWAVAESGRYDVKGIEPGTYFIRIAGHDGGGVRLFIAR